mmetsp:Transcript_12772/g.17197  ORF Transcript_12772/g.17197 Transcript_12772/m.17197 type:complete len:126 (+) Transcript_12772:17-394(+)|eukprot:CAMPEP_0185582654 /NCGR_PEP_ID=MMETSP0434-20130131/21035_1 /TAXON_ID=626734 ORGANISM="Favella taraikaensis, Strain Fe Narragansett Bay" /NCGR_SAMPLE_ID=MMETSP0434 /ASSEMBLY_ACC=CAM_ASM_000379 /LENGTH=125 /DNA_ID=CAMNT_0028201529 /DNA_START=16 /DNA_END=393 /DNA_ORIENTATION=+
MEDGSEVYPGKLLVENAQDLAPGANTYLYLGKVYAQVAGFIQIVKANNWNKLAADQISVTPFHGAEGADNSERTAEASNERGRTLQPRTGDEVYAKVMKVEDRFTKVDIVAIGEEPISAIFIGFI